MNAAVQNLTLFFTIKMLFPDTSTYSCHVHRRFMRRGKWWFREERKREQTVL